jgi:hypothetical protein
MAWHLPKYETVAFCDLVTASDLGADPPNDLGPALLVVTDLRLQAFSPATAACIGEGWSTIGRLNIEHARDGVIVRGFTFSGRRQCWELSLPDPARNASLARALRRFCGRQPMTGLGRPLA